MKREEIQNIINPKYIDDAKIEELRHSFANAPHCKHIILDDFFTEETANLLFEHFPPFESLNVIRKSLNENKREDYNFEEWNPIFQKVRETLASEEWSKILSEITGIDGLFTNFDSLGQGVHQGAQGSYLDVHIDVNVNVEKKIWRRVNLLIYLNKNWKPEYGGDIELWDTAMKECLVKYPPNMNMAMIFVTDENSPHGYSKINIPEGESRKSYYAYYYTPLEEGVEYKDSKFLSRPDDSFAKKTATSFKEFAKIKVKQVLSKLNITSLDFQDKNKKK
ncbi:MAG: 2OG-Fe(II) oxygenase [Chitinophagales bacterium]